MKVGEALITCPGCGDSLPVNVDLHGVTEGYERLRVVFMDGDIKHSCEGRP